jgi:hypothetical protein
MWTVMKEEIGLYKETLEIVKDLIETKQSQKIAERCELFGKKYEKISRMTESKDIEATKADITKYKNKVHIYLKYFVDQH